MEVWYQWYGKDGKPFQESSADRIQIDSKANIADIGETIYEMNKNGLPKRILVSRFKVYQSQGNHGNSSALEIVDLCNLELLEVDRVVSGLGDCKANSLVVVVPEGNLNLISL